MKIPGNATAVTCVATIETAQNSPADAARLIRRCVAYSHLPHRLGLSIYTRRVLAHAQN